MQYQPVGDKILIRPITEKTSKGGILLPADREMDFAKGEVVAVGEGTPDFPMTIKSGDKVLYACKRGKFDTGLPIDEFILVSQSYIIARFYET